MAMYTFGRADSKTGNVTEVKLPPFKAEMERIKPEDRAFYENFNELSFNTPLPWSQGPRKRRVEAQLVRSEEHTSELQSRLHLVCRLLLEKKNTETAIAAAACGRDCIAILHH